MTSIDNIIDKEYCKSELDTIIYEYDRPRHNRFFTWPMLWGYPRSFFRWALG